MKIGKSVPDGAFYTPAQTNNLFAKVSDLTPILAALQEAGTAIQQINGAIEAMQARLLPAATEEDAGKIVAVSEDGSYELISDEAVESLS